MTAKQKVLRAIYPALMKAGKWLGVNATIAKNEEHILPAESLYELTAVANNGIHISFNNFRGKKILIVNTASDCGYTAQLQELETLKELYADKLVILGFPSNDFKQQEQGSDKEIASFCLLNYKIRFLLMKKTAVIKGDQQDPVYQWLSDKQKNGWNEKAPEWNFSKYLINEDGVLTHYFGPGVSPLSNDIQKQL